MKLVDSLETQAQTDDRLQAYSYITRNFAHATPYVIGALRLLAQCYTIDELQEKGYGMYVSKSVSSFSNLHV
jgi:hypothetical protein